ncbi:MAG: hypothetical protein KatS3mg102_2830 [Planctomycetota bacterium]|nr:MAG: hypothetical protein KatS3mg102_2830 [Planctomycetota bacterium]
MGRSARYHRGSGSGEEAGAMQRADRQAVASPVFESVLLDASALGTLDPKERTRVERLVHTAVRNASAELEKLEPRAARFIAQETVDFPIDLEQGDPVLIEALTRAIVRRVKSRLGIIAPGEAEPAGPVAGAAERAGAASSGGPPAATPPAAPPTGG